MTFFAEFFNDFKDFLSWSDKNLTMGGKANRSAILKDRCA
jgi:hypothetical protein